MTTTTSVYLDTALVRRLQDGRVDALLATRLSSPSIRLVFSASHIDDVVSADAATDERMRDTMFRTPNTAFGLPGLLVPTVELSAFLDGARAGERPDVLFADLDAMQDAYPDFVEVRDLQGEYAPWADVRGARTEQKQLWAEAETLGRSARRDSANCSPDDTAWITAFSRHTKRSS